MRIEPRILSLGQRPGQIRFCFHPAVQRLLGQAYLGVRAYCGSGRVGVPKGIQGRLIVTLAHGFESLGDERIWIVTIGPCLSLPECEREHDEEGQAANHAGT